MSKQWGFQFIKENCIQCHGCETACKAWRSVDYGIKWRRVLNICQGQYPNVKCFSASISCLHCVQPSCAEACLFEAITKDPVNGIVQVDSEKCTGCMVCLEACPFGIPQFGFDGKMQKCDMCRLGETTGDDVSMFIPPCVSNCPTNALVIKNMDIDQKTETESMMKKLMQQP